MILFSLLLACSSNIQGTWNGVCTFDDRNIEQDMNVTSQINQDNGYSLEGYIWLETWDGDEFEGVSNGDHNGKYVLIRSNIETEFGPYQFKIEAEKVGQNLIGDCLIQAPDSVGSLIGEIELQK